MKTQKILNVIALAFVVGGILFKTMHWAGANILITLSCLMMIISLVVYGIKDNREAGVKNSLNYFLIGLLVFYIVGILFKMMHWPSARMFVYSAYLIALLVPIVLIFQRENFKVGKQFITSFFIYFILLIYLFPHNPYREFTKKGENTICPHQTECELKPR